MIIFAHVQHIMVLDHHAPRIRRFVYFSFVYCCFIYSTFLLLFAALLLNFDLPRFCMPLLNFWVYSFKEHPLTSYDVHIPKSKFLRQRCLVELFTSLRNNFNPTFQLHFGNLHRHRCLIVYHARLQLEAGGVIAPTRCVFRQKKKRLKIIHFEQRVLSNWVGFRKLYVYS